MQISVVDKSFYFLQIFICFLYKSIFPKLIKHNYFLFKYLSLKEDAEAELICKAFFINNTQRPQRFV